MSFHPQTDGEIEQMNQKLEQYLWFFVDHGQINQPEWLVSAKFVINNKIHLTTNVSINGKLWKRAENGNRYQEKKKDEKSNRVCRKNKENIERDRSSIKEGIKRDKETSKQRKEGDRSIEDRRQGDIEYKIFGIQRKTGK